jgi:hypothetical protein
MLNRIAAFDDGLVGAIESLFESLLRLAHRKQIVYGLEMEHQALKALQQRVVQFPGNPGSFRQSLLKTHYSQISLQRQVVSARWQLLSRNQLRSDRQRNKLLEISAHDSDVHLPLSRLKGNTGRRERKSPGPNG